jgi:hypothetical protein
VLADCVKDGKHEDAEEFLFLYLDALGGELVELQTYIRPVSAPSAGGLEERVQTAEGQTEVVKREYTVRLFSLLSLCTVLEIEDTCPRIGEFSRVTHLEHIRWKVPFDHTRAKSA